MEALKNLVAFWLGLGETAAPIKGVVDITEQGLSGERVNCINPRHVFMWLFHL